MTGRHESFEARRHEQVRAWLRTSYRERLEWLEQAKRFAARATEAARRRAAQPRAPTADDEGRTAWVVANGRRVTPDELTGTIRAFSPLVCWEVSLAIGSLLSVEFGARVSFRYLDGEEGATGSCTLSLDGDRWVISQDGAPVVDSESIDRVTAEEVIAPLLVGSELIGIALKRGALEIELSRGLVVHVEAAPSDMPDDDLVVFFFPDGSIVCFSPGAGLYRSNDVASRRARDWSRRQP